MPTFVLIGHCGPDAYLLKRAISRAVPGAAIAFANDEPSLQASLDRGNILLINRVLDSGFDVDGGVELITRLAKADERPAMMLVSNFNDAQRHAVEAGALPGFGKRDLSLPRTAELLRLAAEAAAGRTSDSTGAHRI
jgi:hypothetical protein